MDLFTTFVRDILLTHVHERGYAFLNISPPSVLEELEREMDSLPLETGDHVTYPINAGTPREVRQLHARAYRMLDDASVPFASIVCRALGELFGAAPNPFPELIGWMPNEIGYQLYRDGGGWISPHRDRSTDRLLSVTFTISGSAPVRIHKPETNPPDYRRLRQIDEFITVPGTAFFLRAPGFGSGEQEIHEVLPPIGGPRKILNLRSRPTLLPAPTAHERL